MTTEEMKKEIHDHVAHVFFDWTDPATEAAAREHLMKKYDAIFVRLTPAQVGFLHRRVRGSSLMDEWRLINTAAKWSNR